ncbi:MAG: DUF4345 family protein [Myxococcota bacterium]
MNTALRIILGIFVIVMLGFGLTIMFNPTAMVDQLAVDPRGVEGLSTLRAGHGAFLASIGIMIGLGLRARYSQWFLASALLITMALIGRMAGLAFDGMPTGFVGHVGQEIVMIVLLVTAHVRLGSRVS